jgi:hypothetical protein
MPSVQVKNVPPDVHRILRTRAAENGQSLQEFLLALLVEEARYESLNRILDRIESFAGGSVSSEFAVQAIREDRDHR